MARLLTALARLFIILLQLSMDWLIGASQNLQENDATAKQQVPADAPLELVA